MPSKITVEERDKFLALIKDLNLDLQTIENEEYRKWYKFGAYYALKMVTEKVVAGE